MKKLFLIRQKKLLVLLILMLFAVFWIFWLPGPRVSTDFSRIMETSLKKQMDYPQTWINWGTEGLGEYTVFTLWSYPLSLLMGILANLGLSFNLIQRLLLIIPFLLFGVFNIWKLGEYFKLSPEARFISTLFYMTTTYVLLLIDGGQLTIALAYGFFPLAFLSVEKALTGNLKNKIQAALAVSLIGVFDLRFIFVLALLCLIRFMYGFGSWLWLKQWIKTAVTILLVYFGLNFYWIFIYLKYPLSSATFASLTKTSFVSFISLSHAFLLLSPNWYENIFGQTTPVKAEFLAVPVLAFLGLIFRPKNRQVGFWLIVALVGIFLTKGSAEPFGGIYPWFYLHVPGFSLFRDASKFFFLISLAYALLIGVTTDEVIKRFPKARLFFLSILTIYFLFLIRPVWLNQMTGVLSNPPSQVAYNNLNQIIASDPDISNVFWIPTISPQTNLDTNHPSLEALRLMNKRPFAQANVGTYERFNFLREAPYMGQIFDIANIGFVSYPPPDLRRQTDKDQIKYYSTFLSQLSNLPWLKRIDQSAIPLFKVTNHQAKMFIAPNVWWVIGSDNLYPEATTSSQLALSKNGLIFAEESTDLEQRFDQIPQPKILLNQKTLTDLAASFIKPENLIFPAYQLQHDPDSSGWWKRETSDFIYWKDFLKNKYGIYNQDFDLGGGWAVGEGSVKLKVQSEKLKKDQILLARVLESTRSGSLTFSQNNQVIGQIDTKKPGDNVRWFEVGNLNSNGDLTVKSSGDINVINALAILPANIWQQDQQKAQDLLQKNKITTFTGNNVATGAARISYKYNSPTHINVTVSGLTNPQMLIFSQNFDKNWLLNGQEPLPVYSLLNGYQISQNGQYDLIFEPQKYIIPALVVSGITLLLTLIILLV